MSTRSLSTLAAAVESLSDPRSKQGVSHPYHGMLLLVLLGLLAQIPEIARIRRWTKNHWAILQEPLKFKKTKPPVATTISRALAKTTVADFQKVIAEFLRNIIAEDHDFIVGAVDGKVAKQMKDEDADPILRLNIFAHNIKVTLMSYSVSGDKTNEPGCLKAHLEELFTMYPMLKLLTGDAIFAQRPLLEVLQEHGCDYLFQIKANQPDILDAAKTCFANVDPDKPDYQSPVEKKNGNAETRKIWINNVDAEYVREQLNVPGCNVLIRVDRVVREPGGKTTTEPRYFISSLMLSAMCLLRLIRGHWEVENCLHWMKDSGWNEDGHYLKRGQDTFVAMTDAALSILRLMQKPDESVQEVTDYVRDVPKNILHLLGIM